MKKEVQLYNPSETETGQDFSHCLCKRFGKYKFTSVTKDQISREEPLVVVAHNYSRIGTDIDTVTCELTDVDPGQVAIVVLHVAQKHALPSLKPTTVLVDEKYSNYRCMTDFFYTPDDKIYSCSLNDEATRDLNQFLKDFANKTKTKTKTKESQPAKKGPPDHSTGQSEQGHSIELAEYGRASKQKDDNKQKGQPAKKGPPDHSTGQSEQGHSIEMTEYGRASKQKDDNKQKGQPAKKGPPDHSTGQSEQGHSIEMTEYGRASKQKDDNKQKAKCAQLYDPAMTETSAGFRRSLCKKFYKYELRSMRGRDTLCQISRDLPLLVIAHNYSRIGTDIDTAVDGLPAMDAAQIAIVVFHVRSKHALPALMPTSNLVDEKYAKYGCLVDFFYTPEDNIYSCQLNRDAEEFLKSFLKSKVEKIPWLKRSKTCVIM